MLLLSSILLLAGAQTVFANCKCTPKDPCWPSPSKWNALNATVHGKLVRNEPLAKPCYQGPGYDAEQCQNVAANWTENQWIAESPIGYSYPLVVNCPPINATIPSYPTCQLGNDPVYSIKATNAADVANGIKFAKDNNVRLVIKNTGHDISFKSQGYGSFSIWIWTVRDGMQFHEKYASNTSCKSNWTGSAITIGGGYVWREIYDFATKHNSVVVGGGDPTVGSIGGFLQGAGHGSLSHQFGLATDQVLEYKVVLADGKVVTANECQYTDLFTALRGGGGSTYGVVLSATVKAFPTRPTLYHELTIIDKRENSSALLNVTGCMAAKFPLIVDEGFSGSGILKYVGGKWSYDAPFIKFLDDNSTQAIEHAKQVMEREILDGILPGNGTDYVVLSKWSTHQTWADWYGATSHETPGHNQPMMASRFFDKKSLLNQEEKLTKMMYTLGSKPKDGKTSFFFNIVAGGKVLQDAPHTSVNPAWRKTYLLFQKISGYDQNADEEAIAKYKKTMTTEDLAVMKAAAPGMGTYQNEADPWDPDWKKDWFGDRYDWLVSMKKKYDPGDVFWCWRCVGNDNWKEVTGGALYGPLCQANATSRG
ncbi:hypothetical protein KEM55_002327 [Ascosphaera atra]|nr:hypothetical protein KEM55_002327 [Ascosphaera atra]